MSASSDLPADTGATLLDRLAGLEVATGLAELAQSGLGNTATALYLARSALDEAERSPARAAHWLQLGEALNHRLGDEPLVQGWLAYAQARLFVQTRQLTRAETALRLAQAAWQASGDQEAVARSHLGLSQILAMSGRYTAAENANRAAIAQLSTLAPRNSLATEQLASAHNNLANLLLYQEKHEAALFELEHARQLLEPEIAQTHDQPELRSILWAALAAVLVNQATALMSLDRTEEAEARLQHAIHHYDRLQDLVNRGRAHTNLGSLYLRTGRYTAALHEFDAATRDLLGTESDRARLLPEAAQNADILLLDKASVYLALNLLPEASTTLAQCEALLRTADQPYELGQSLLLSGILRLRAGDLTGAATALRETERLFQGLQNSFWLNRTEIALATLDLQHNARQRAVARLDTLLTQHPWTPPVRDTVAEAVRWDIGSWVEAQLLRLELHLEANELEDARRCAAAVAAAIEAPPNDATPELGQVWLPHLFLRWQHALGRIEQTAGDQVLARRHFYAAIALLESQRATLPIEELRTAFLVDKSTLYSDLVLSLLEEADAESLRAAFAVMERARARALLERLLATLSGQSTVAPTAALAQQRAEVQQRLHWLYNQLLSTGQSRHPASVLNQQIRSHEAALQELAWQTALPLAEAQPADLTMLQQTLGADQQALVYYSAGAEVLALVVSRGEVQLFRHLCTVDKLAEAQADWRFQLERAAMGEKMLARHAERYQRAWQRTLGRLYELVIAPLDQALCQPRLLVIPHGSLHRAPFHALWDGRQLLVERFEWTTAPSVSVAVRTQRRQPGQPWRSLAALALSDATIPAARQEVEAAARCFAQARLYLDEQASLQGLYAAAAGADVLHLATHGRFRPDNPFFSVLKLADGWVDVRNLYQLPLTARLVVLSACESGASGIGGGDEVIGVARPFLAAGVEALVASLWHAHDASTAALMKNFYSALTGEATAVRPAAALRVAQLQAVRQGQHPFFWASFFVVGA